MDFFSIPRRYNSKAQVYNVTSLRRLTKSENLNLNIKKLLLLEQPIERGNSVTGTTLVVSSANTADGTTLYITDGNVQSERLVLE